MSAPRTYGSPGAFRRALTDKLREQAKTGPWTLPQLQRQMAYDRLLERLYLVDDRWIVKGATALLARALGVRGTVDVDVYRDAPLETAAADLHEAVARDIGDWFRFEIGAQRPILDGTNGMRLPITSYVGATVWASFHVDLVGSDVRMTGKPDAVGPLASVTMPDVEQHGYRAYPLVDHIADKVVATVKRYGSDQHPSTRYKDLVDLVAIISAVSVNAAAQLYALNSEASRRNVRLPTYFAAPDRDIWERGYAAEAQRSLLLIAPRLDEALAIVRPFVDPLLDQTAAGVWMPKAGEWSGAPAHN